ncbi:MAG: glycosyltransferase N-terminal domain-containing protein [Candidatus Caenarcaniphilales bacterium]|nr:glycosyltransferase N-terminal domain-containing protein [Candidatus Caenarcaniphilales bacterium]
MFWFFIYRTLSIIVFVLGLPVVTTVCLLTKKWRDGLDQKLGLIDYETIKQLRGAHFVDLLGKLKQSEQPNSNNKSTIDFDNLSKTKQKNIWLHAVSFGEVKTIEPFVYKLQEAFPEYQLCLSTGTKTGQDLARKLFTDLKGNLRLKKEIFVFYKPFDFYFAVKNWLDLIKPEMVIIAETEIWPELLIQSCQRSIPCFLVNARLTEKSASGYKKLFPLWKQVLKAFKIIFAQTDFEKNLFKSIGAEESKIKVLGNLKFDSMQPAPESILNQLRNELNLPKSACVFIAGSTHQDEEGLVCKAYLEALKKYPQKDIRLVLAPRHPERLGEVYELIKKLGLPFMKRSAVTSPASLTGGAKTEFPLSRGLGGDDWQILVLDTLGELNKFYGLADFAFLGGTWADIGGHNPLEPASYGLQTLIGPKSYKIPDLVRQLKIPNLVIEFDSSNDFEQKFMQILDSLLPLSGEEIQEMKRNRLLSFAPQKRLSEATIELVLAAI